MVLLQPSIEDMTEGSYQTALNLCSKNDKLSPSLPSDTNETYQTIEDPKGQLRQTLKVLLATNPRADKQPDEVDLPLYPGLMSVSNGVKEVEMKENSKDFPTLPSVAAGCVQAQPLPDAALSNGSRWAKRLTSSEGDGEFQTGVPGTNFSPLHTQEVPTSKKLSIVNRIRGGGTSTLIRPIIPVNKFKSNGLYHYEFSENSPPYLESEEKPSLEWEIEGSMILKKLKQLCVQAFKYIKDNKKREETLVNNLRLIDDLSEPIMDEIYLVEHYLRQDIILLDKIDELQLSLEEIPTEGPEPRYNRIQFLDSVFTEYDKQERSLHYTPNKNDSSLGANVLRRTPPKPVAPPEWDFINLEAPLERLSVHEPTSESVPLRILDDYRSLNIQFNKGQDENILLDVIPLGLLNTNGSTTCYINAGLQLLSSVPKIFRCVKDGLELWKKSENKDFRASNAFVSFMEERNWMMEIPVEERNLGKHFSPDMVLDVIFQRYSKQFKRNTQQDCMEFVTTFLEAIHAELGEERSPLSKLFTGVQRRFMRKGESTSFVGDYFLSFSRQHGLEINRDLPTEIKEGTPTNSIKPPSPEREEFTNVTLHFTSNHLDIEDCFSFYTSKQYSSEGKSFHWCLFEKLPRLLLVHLLSFNESEKGPKKALRSVILGNILHFKKEWMYQETAEEVPAEAEKVPVEEVAAETVHSEEVPTLEKLLPAISISSGDLSSTDEASETDSRDVLVFDSSDQDSVFGGAHDLVSECPTQYHLRAVALHSGPTTTSGHYTAAVSVPDRSGHRVWYLCNDHLVKRMTSLYALEDYGQDAEVTCLLYEREECSAL